VRVALGWTLDMFFPVDSVQLPTERTRETGGRELAPAASARQMM